ncbi:MAG: NAD(P)-dependent glycerol-3-phosphate dehydrogenase [Thiotrichales bacterium]|nr:NAD(P)-dependent glycerol-3-phosphate dehydrogenase [Thiotrichales bacterium]
MPATLLVAGAGSWGTALAIVLARNGHDIILWDHIDDHIRALEQTRENQQFLPGVTLPDNISCRADLGGCTEKLSGLIVAVPCHAVRQVLINARTALGSLPAVCLVCKGLEPGTHLLSHEIVSDELGPDQAVAILSGPSFAREVAAGLPTAVTVASTLADIASDFARLFHNDHFRIYTNDDVTGVAIAGAIKNVLAIGAGIADGLGFGANTRAALITRGLAEITRLGMAMGGKPDTFMGLSGLGDLVLTCTDDQSRNRRLGLALARGDSLESASQQIGQAIEGAKTAHEIGALAAKHGVEMPISAEVLNVITGVCTPQDAVQNLLSRDPRSEQH